MLDFTLNRNRRAGNLSNVNRIVIFNQDIIVWVIGDQQPFLINTKNLLLFAIFAQNRNSHVIWLYVGR